MENITLLLTPETQHTHAIGIETLHGKERGPPLGL